MDDLQIAFCDISIADYRKPIQPDMTWTSSQLRGNGVNFSEVLPVAYLYDRFLEMAPNRVRLPKA